MANRVLGALAVGGRDGRRPVLSDRAAAVALGLLIDQLAGEPPAPAHPVARFGQAMTALERRWWADDRGAGARYLSVGMGTAIAFGWVAGRGLGRRGALALATATAAAGRSLLDAAAEIGSLLEAGELEQARAALPTLVGRDPEGLSAEEMARAVIESVAENLSDAVVATAWWGLVAGAPGVLAHRAANTLDAMVGHHDPRYERFGWAAARFDDLLGWVPARLTALLTAVARPAAAGSILRTVRRDAPAHPSPNAGVSEAAFAAVLGLRLGGTNRYGGRVEVRGPLGEGATPAAADVLRAVSVANRMLWILTGVLGLVSLAGWRCRVGQ